MSSPTKRRASSTNSGRARNDEADRPGKMSDSERGMQAAGGKAAGEGKAKQGKKSPSAVAGNRSSG